MRNSATTTPAFIAFTAILLGSTIASAQSPYRYHAPIHSPVLVQRHASTIAEGYFRGVADLTRARGEFNYNTSLALRHREEARSLALDNQVKATQAYFTKRKINEDARNENRRERPTLQDIERFNKTRTPKRLTNTQYDVALAKVSWPASLQIARYQGVRDQVDRLIANRSFSDGGELQIQDITQAWIEDLNKNIRNMPPTDFLSAKRFLTSLQYEMHFPANASGLAAR